LSIFLQNFVRNLRLPYDQKYVKHLNDENKSLKADNTELKTINTDLHNHISELEAELAKTKL
jgi:cell division protein FtsB